ncbi:MAG: lytic transglycosylase domain-containing protein [Bdellovibrionales bacterium]|nr:lytic transglycosylase domain-containing protein [Bdellovibrionales bacterium]
MGCQPFDVQLLTSLDSRLDAADIGSTPSETDLDGIPPGEPLPEPPHSEPATTPGDANFIWPRFDWNNQNEDFLDWNFYAYEAIRDLGAPLTSKNPNDILEFCPSYNSLDDSGRKMFWISLIAAMARFESGFNPETRYTEAFRDALGQFIISRGLLQLSIESARGYGCELRAAEDLHDPQINLECTVRILTRWVDRDGVITGKVGVSWRGGARYWSVLRKASTLSSIRSKTSKSNLCKK